MTRLIGLLGAKGSGKDTLAKILIARLGFVRLSFADALYREVAEAYGVAVAFLENRETKETPLPELALANCRDADFVSIALEAIHAKRGYLGRAFSFLLRSRDLRAPRSPRWTMQLWGTEYRRKSKFGCDTYWIDKVRVQVVANPNVRYVITDVRFKNEAQMVRIFGGLLIRVRRLLLEEKEAAARAAGTLTALHPSETEMVDYPVDAEAFNREGAPASLTEGLGELLPELTRAA